MAQVSLFRKYRSQTFDDLVGQEHVVRTIQNSIRQGRIGQAYLFTGPRGTGKTSTARLLAKALNCTGGPSADIPDDCPICADITAGRCMDVIEIDAASEAGVDDVRASIVEAAEYRPIECRYKVFIIDEVHDLSSKAFDALLKTIEEPPEHVVFILATTESHKVPPTIKSRCLRFDFHRGTIEELVGRLEHVVKSEGKEAEPAALTTIARLADGGYRDALTLLEQALVTADGALTLDHVNDQLGLVADQAVDALIGSVSAGDVKATVESVEAIYRSGRDPRSIVESLLHRLSELTRAFYSIDGGVGADQSVEAALTATAKRLGADRLLALRSGMSLVHKEIASISLPRIWLESELVRIGQSLNAPAQPVAAVRPQAQSAPSPPPSNARTSEAAASTPAKPQEERVAVTQPEPQAVAEVVEGDAGTWQKVVQALSSVSKTAAMRLTRSRLAGREENVVTIEFDRLTDAEWVSDSMKVQQALIKSWKDASGDDIVYRFVGKGQRSTAPAVATASVESVYEGEALRSQAEEVFQIGGQAASTSEGP